MQCCTLKDHLLFISSISRFHPALVESTGGDFFWLVTCIYIEWFGRCASEKDTMQAYRWAACSEVQQWLCGSPGVWTCNLLITSSEQRTPTASVMNKDPQRMGCVLNQAEDKLFMFYWVVCFMFELPHHLRKGCNVGTCNNVFQLLQDQLLRFSLKWTIREQHV